MAAQVVYNEFIADGQHIHMNSTKWLSLSDFVKYLGREGKCKVEETPKGWFITIIMVKNTLLKYACLDGSLAGSFAKLLAPLI